MDSATSDIRQSLLNACSLGEEVMQIFLKERLLERTAEENIQHIIKFDDPLKKIKALTFKDLYTVVVNKKKTDKTMSIKANRSIFQRLVVAYEGKRNVDLQQIFKHELMPVPTALANLNGTLRSGNKSLLKQDVIYP